MYYPFVNCQFCNSLPAFACRRSQCRLAKGCRRPVVLGRADAGGRDVRHLSRRRPRSDPVPPLLYPSTDRMCIFPHQNHSPGRSSWTRRALGSSTGTPHRRRPGEARRSWGGGGVTGGGDLETTVCGRRICQEEKFYHRTHHTQGLGKKKTGAGHGPAGIKKTLPLVLATTDWEDIRGGWFVRPNPIFRTKRPRKEKRSWNANGHISIL
jgi:hypothetical protein